MRLFALPLFALCAAALPQTRDTNSSADGLAQTAAILEATNTFLSLLTEDQRAGALFPYDSQDTAAAVLVQGTGPVSARQFLAEGFGQSLWSNYPYGYIPRPGVKAGNLTDVQYQAMLGVLSAMLSEEGYSKVHDIMAADAWLGEMAAATVSTATPYGINSSAVARLTMSRMCHLWATLQVLGNMDLASLENPVSRTNG